MFGSTKLLEQRIAGLEEEVADLKEANKALDSVVGVLIKELDEQVNMTVETVASPAMTLGECLDQRNVKKTWLATGKSENSYLHTIRYIASDFNAFCICRDIDYPTVDDVDEFILNQLHRYSFRTVEQRIGALKTLFKEYAKQGKFPALQTGIGFSTKGGYIYDKNGKHPELKRCPERASRVDRLF